MVRIRKIVGKCVCGGGGAGVTGASDSKYEPHGVWVQGQLGLP